MISRIYTNELPSMNEHELVSPPLYLLFICLLNWPRLSLLSFPLSKPKPLFTFYENANAPTDSEIDFLFFSFSCDTSLWNIIVLSIHCASTTLPALACLSLYIIIRSFCRSHRAASLLIYFFRSLLRALARSRSSCLCFYI